MSEDLIIKGAGGIKDGLYVIKDGELFKYKENGGTVRTVRSYHVTDRPTAKWTTNKLGYFECTACETMLFMKQRDWRFCPFCGAVLEGEEEL